HVSVVEAKDCFHLHRDASLSALNDPHQVDLFDALVYRHEVDYRDNAIRRFEFSFEDQRIAPVLTSRVFYVSFGSDQPPPISLVAEQRGEARGRIEARNAQPVDGSVLTDQRGGAGGADD